MCLSSNPSQSLKAEFSGSPFGSCLTQAGAKSDHVASPQGLVPLAPLLAPPLQVPNV